jgi:hypothetical protein
MPASPELFTWSSVFNSAKDLWPGVAGFDQLLVLTAEEQVSIANHVLGYGLEALAAESENRHVRRAAGRLLTICERGMIDVEATREPHAAPRKLRRRGGGAGRAADAGPDAGTSSAYRRRAGTNRSTSRLLKIWSCRAAAAARPCRTRLVGRLRTSGGRFLRPGVSQSRVDELISERELELALKDVEQLVAGVVDVARRSNAMGSRRMSKARAPHAPASSPRPLATAVWTSDDRRGPCLVRSCPGDWAAGQA